jgi:hypothetical protein
LLCAATVNPFRRTLLRNQPAIATGYFNHTYLTPEEQELVISVRRNGWRISLRRSSLDRPTATTGATE